MHGVYIGNNKMLITPLWGGKLLVPADDLSVGLDLVTHGFIEGPLTNYLFKNVKPNDTVCDIGANIGYFTVILGYLVGTGGTVLAYEPNPNLFSFLFDNLSINYLHDRSTLHQKAVYSVETDLNLYLTKRFLGNSSIHHYDDEYFKHYADQIENIQVHAEPLDNQIKHVPHIDLVKIDIEGGEYHAFLGMQNMLKTQAIETVVFELNKPRLQEDWHPFTKLLLELAENYRKEFFTIADQGELVQANIKELLIKGSYPFVVMKSAPKDY